MVSHQKVARDTTEAGVMRMVGALATVLPFVALVQVLANTVDYRQPAVAVAVWLAILAAAAWLVPKLRRGRLTAGHTAAAIAIALGGVSAIGSVHRPNGPQGSVDLAILGTIWLLVLTVLSARARVWFPAALVVFCVHSGLLIHDEGLSRLILSQLEAAGYVVTAVLIAFSELRPTLAMQASVAARRASLASRSAAERAAADAIAQERRGRLAVLEKEALPLLRGIADGTLDPAAAEVRDQCARHAAVLRDSLAARAPRPGELTAALGPALSAARDRGLLVAVQLIGDPGTPRPEVAQAAAVAVNAVLSELPPHQATLTVLAAGDDVELYLTFGAALRGVPEIARPGPEPPAAVRWRAALSVTEEDGGCLELSWRRDGAD